MSRETTRQEGPGNPFYDAARKIFDTYFALARKMQQDARPKLIDTLLDRAKQEFGSQSPELVQTITRILEENFKSWTIETVTADLQSGKIKMEKLQSFVQLNKYPHDQAPVIVLGKLPNEILRVGNVMLGGPGRSYYAVGYPDGSILKYTLEEIAPIPPVDPTS